MNHQDNECKFGVKGASDERLLAVLELYNNCNIKSRNCNYFNHDCPTSAGIWNSSSECSIYGEHYPNCQCLIEAVKTESKRRGLI